MHRLSLAIMMKEKIVSMLFLIALVIIGVLALWMAWYGGKGSWKFLLALFPLLVILFGVAFFKQSGLAMAVVGLIVSVILAVTSFATPLDVAVGGACYGFIKSFGISISVIATMYMIFLMKEVEALKIISQVITRQVVGREVQALYIGIGFGTFLSCLGVVTPSLFPPLLIAMGFTPLCAIAISVLGYNATTSFALLSIPITLPAKIGGLNPLEFAFKISIFLPVVSIGISFAILWIIGGVESMKKGVAPALVSGLSIALACLCFTSVDYLTGIEYVPLRIVGVLSGLLAMLSLHVHQKIKPSEKRKEESSNDSHYTTAEILKAFSPWIILTILASIISIPQVGTWLADLPGKAEVFTVFADQTVDLDILSQIYTWIIIATIISVFFLKPSKTQLKNSTIFWLKRFLIPFLAYSLYFSIAFVMSFSAMQVSNSVLQPITSFREQNMNVILGTTLADIFGTSYVFVAATIGLFGAVIGGSEASSNVLFLNVQKEATAGIGLNEKAFMTVYGSHAVAGGTASAITPAKINNAVVTIDETKETESLIMRKHLIITILLTVAACVLTGLFIALGI